MTTNVLAHEQVWFDKWRYEDAERQYYENKSGPAKVLDGKVSKSSSGDNKLDIPLVEEESTSHNAEQVKDVVPVATSDVPSSDTHTSSTPAGSGLGSLASQIAKARQDIQNSLSSGSHVGSTASTTTTANIPSAGVSADVQNRLTKLGDENLLLRKTVTNMEQAITELTKRVSALECGGKTTIEPKKPVQEVMEEDDDDDDDVDLFGSDEEEEDAEAARIREERLKAYAEKKSKKVGPIAKSSVLLDCKPWSDETDMKQMETEIRKIEKDGLRWGAAKLIPLAYGIQKLAILCTVEDEKVSIDDLSEQICEIEEYVQSVDIAAFNKV